MTLCFPTALVLPLPADVHAHIASFLLHPILEARKDRETWQKYYLQRLMQKWVAAEQQSFISRFALSPLWSVHRNMNIHKVQTMIESVHLYSVPALLCWNAGLVLGLAHQSAVAMCVGGRIKDSNRIYR